MGFKTKHDARQENVNANVDDTVALIDIGGGVPGLPALDGSSLLNLPEASETFTVPGHGLAVGDVVRWNGTAWVKAQADTADNSEAQGMVKSVVGDDFSIAYAGRVNGLTGLTAGCTYFLDDSVAGALVTTSPSSISKPIFFATSTTSGILKILRGMSDAGSATHSLGSATHTADTLAALNAKVSDGTLVDVTAGLAGSRPAASIVGRFYFSTDTGNWSRDNGSTWDDVATGGGAHNLGGAEHTADTLANLNTKVSDATLIDTADSRLSDARTPTSHGLGGTEHATATLAQLNAKVSDATLIDTADARLSDNRTADAIATSGADVTIGTTAPTTGQVLTATGATAATWQTPSGGGTAVKSAFAEVTGDSSTSASHGSPATLLSLALTPASASNKFLIWVTASGQSDSTADRIISIQLWYGLTGSTTRRRAARIFSDTSAGNESGACAIAFRIAALGTGEHTFQVKWGISASTAQIYASSRPNEDHASLMVQEVTG